MKNSKSAANHCDSCPSRESGIFCELEKLALDDLSHHKVTNIFKKGQTLFVEGNPPHGVFCVSQGNVKITKMGDDGKDSILRIAKGGDVIGHRSIFTEQSNSTTATALEDTIVCFIDKKYIMRMVQQQPSVAVNLIGKLGKDLGLSEGKIASFSQKNVRERVSEFLLLLKESHGEKTSKGIKINIKLTRDEMASMVGTASETLIRFVSELKNENAITQEGKIIYITDENKLLQFANVSY